MAAAPTTRARYCRRGGTRWWLLAAVCLATLLISYLTVAALLAVVVAGEGEAQFDPVLILLAALPAWLACYQVPLMLNGAVLGVLPLLPTGLIGMLIGAAAAVYARRCRLRRLDQAWPVVLTFGLVHAFVTGLIAMVAGQQVAVLPAEAFLRGGALAALGAAVGVSARCGVHYLLWARFGAPVWTGLRAGFRGIAALLGAGSIVVLVAALAALPRLLDLYGTDTFGAGFGRTALSVLYLPNAVLAGWSFAVGTGVSFGPAVIRPLQLESGDMPAFPLLRLIPLEGPQVWWPLLCVLPLITGVLIAGVCRRAHPRSGQRLLAVLVAVTVLLVGTLVLANCAGGTLADGALNPIGLTPGMLALGTVCWVAPPAALVTWLLPAPEAFDVADDEVADRLSPDGLDRGEDPNAEHDEWATEDLADQDDLDSFWDEGDDQYEDDDEHALDDYGNEDNGVDGQVLGHGDDADRAGDGCDDSDGSEAAEELWAEFDSSELDSSELERADVAPDPADAAAEAVDLDAPGPADASARTAGHEDVRTSGGIADEVSHRGSERLRTYGWEGGGSSAGLDR